MTKEAVRAQRPFSNLVLCLQMVLRHLVVEGLVADPSVARSGRWRWEPRLAPAVARMALTRVGLERRGVEQSDECEWNAVVAEARLN